MDDVVAVNGFLRVESLPAFFLAFRLAVLDNRTDPDISSERIGVPMSDETRHASNGNTFRLEWPQGDWVFVRLLYRRDDAPGEVGQVYRLPKREWEAMWTTEEILARAG